MLNCTYIDRYSGPIMLLVDDEPEIEIREDAGANVRGRPRRLSNIKHSNEKTHRSI